MEPARGGEGALHQRFRHAVIGRVEEADILAGVAHHRGGAVEGAGLAGEAGPEIDQRDLRRGRGIIAHRMFLEQIHLGPFRRQLPADYKAPAAKVPVAGTS